MRACVRACVLACVRKCARACEWVLQKGKYILKTIAKRLKIPATKVPDSIISNYGNQSSASIPCAINVTMNADEKKMAILSGFGVGLSWASVYCELNLNYCPEPIIWSK